MKRVKNIAGYILLLIFFVPVYAQDVEENADTSESDTLSEPRLEKIININTRPFVWVRTIPSADVEVGRETPWNETSTTSMYVSLQMNQGLLRRIGDTGKYVVNFSYTTLRPEFAIRKYLNLGRRLRKERSIAQNTGSYVSFYSELFFGKTWATNDSYVYGLFAARYGIQRAWDNHIFINAEGGPTLLIDDMDELLSGGYPSDKLGFFPVYGELRVGYNF